MQWRGKHTRETYTYKKAKDNKQKKEIKKQMSSKLNTLENGMVLGAHIVFSAALNAAVELNVFDIIAKGGSMSPSEIASKLPTKHNTHSDLPNRVERFLCLFVSYSLLTASTRTHKDGSTETLYGITQLGKLFINNSNENVEESLASFVLLYNHPAVSGLWLHLKEAILDPEINLFNKVHGVSVYEYFGKDKKLNSIFNKSMAELSSIQMKGILEEYRGFEGIKTLVDVGGGYGQSLKMIISKYTSIKAINFDLPQVLEHAPTLPGIEHVAGNMFESVPEGDAMMIKGVLHNWSDEECIKILSNCYKALPPNGKVILMEMIEPENPEATNVSKINSSTSTFMCIMTTGGMERTQKQIEFLSKCSGFSRLHVADCSIFLGLEVMEIYK